MQEEKSGSGLIGIYKLMGSITVMVVAGLAVLLLFDVIPDSVFSEGVQKVLLLAVIVALTTGVLALIARVGK